MILVDRVTSHECSQLRRRGLGWKEQGVILVDRVTSQGCSQLGKKIRVEGARSDLSGQYHIIGMLTAGEKGKGGRSKE